MRQAIRQLSQSETFNIIHEHGFNLVEGKDNGVWQKWIAATSATWVGAVDGELVCMWGVIPPTLLSSQCYLWLFTTPEIKGNEFRFTRHSQVVIEEILEEYPEIIGHVRAGEDRSMRWLKWLGAELGEPEGLFIPFVIRAK